MRFIVMHKVPPRYASGVLDQREMAQMGAFIQESVKNGTMLNGAGLLPNVPRTRVVFRDGQCTVTEASGQGGNNLLSAFAAVEVADRGEAIAWAKRFGTILGTCELEIGRVTEAWDLGFVPKPTTKVPEHYLVLFMADANSEAGKPPSEREMKEVPALVDEMVKAKVLQFTEGILPSKLGTRLTFQGGKRVSALDGPFSESKELISGFCLISVPSKEAAVAWAERYGSILMDIEVDVLQLHEQAAYDGKK